MVRGYLKTAGETHDMTTSRARESAVIINKRFLKLILFVTVLGLRQISS